MNNDNNFFIAIKYKNIFAKLKNKKITYFSLIRTSIIFFFKII